MKISEIEKASGEIQALKAAIRHRKEMGIFTDEDDKFLADNEAKIIVLKEKFTKQLSAMPKGAKVAIKDSDDVSVVEDFFCSILVEGDNAKGNMAMVKAMLERVPLDYPTLCEERALLPEAASDGNLEFLDLLLSIPGVRFDAIDLISTVLYSQLYRIPGALILLKHEKVLQLEEVLDDVKDMFQEFLSDICNKKKSVQRENRKGRLDLVERLLDHPLLGIDPDWESSTCQTIFSQACADNDTDLMALLLGSRHVSNINRMQSDRTTPLIQAVIGNAVEAVTMLIMQQGLDVNYECDDGSALALAKGLQRDEMIVAALKARGAKEGSRTPGCKLPPVEIPPKAAPPNKIENGKTNLPPLKASDKVKEDKEKDKGREVTAKPETTNAKEDEKDKKEKEFPQVKASSPTGVLPRRPSIRRESIKIEVKEPRSLKRAVTSASGTRSHPFSQPTPPPGKAPASRGRAKSNVSFGAPSPPNVPAPSSARRSIVSIMDNEVSPNVRRVSSVVHNNWCGDGGGRSTPAAILARVFKAWSNSATNHLAEHGSSIAHRISTVSGSRTAIMRYWLHEFATRIYQIKYSKTMLKIFRAITKSGAKPKAKAAAPASIRAKGKLISAKSAKTLKAQGVSAAHGGYSIIDLVDVIRLQKLSVKSMVSMGVFTDEEEEKKKEAEKTISEHKRQLLEDLTEKYKKTRQKFEPAADETSAFETLVDELISELDTVPDNAELFRLLLECVKMDWPTICETKGLLSLSCCDGSLEYMQALLSYPQIRFDVVDVMLSAMYNQTYRIPATALLFRHEHVLRLESHLDELQKPLEDFVAEIASQKRALQREVRTGRLQLIEKLMTHKVIKIDPELEGDDGQTVFSRAAHEGDHELMSLLIKIKRAPNINRVQSDKTTALIQAVFSNSVPTVALLLMQPGINVNYASPEGTALNIGIALKRDLGIVQKLKALSGKTPAENHHITIEEPKQEDEMFNSNAKAPTLKLENMLGNQDGSSNINASDEVSPVVLRRKTGIVSQSGVVVVDVRKRASTVSLAENANNERPEKKKQIKSMTPATKAVVKKKF